MEARSVKPLQCRGFLSCLRKIILHYKTSTISSKPAVVLPPFCQLVKCIREGNRIDNIPTVRILPAES